MEKKWAGFGMGTIAEQRIQRANVKRQSALTLNTNDESVTFPSALAAVYLSGTTTSAKPAAPAGKTASNFTTLSSEAKAEDTASTTSSLSASAVISSSTPDSSTSNSPSGDPGNGRSSAAAIVIGGERYRELLNQVPDDAVEEAGLFLQVGPMVEYYCGPPERPQRSRVVVGDALERLRDLPSESVHSIVTSPPYYALRDYQTDGQIGREKTVQEYVDNVVAIMREARRVLREDGTCWLVLGDTYATSGGSGKRGATSARAGRTFTAEGAGATPGRSGVKRKSLIGVPWRIAFAMEADGWILRSEIIWEKPNCMPESVRDRVTRAHETIFVFAKSERYYWDKYAILENSNSGTRSGRAMETGAIRNARSVWRMASEPYRGKHFATFPTKLVEKIIGVSTSRWVCKACGKPWARVVEKVAAEGRGSGQHERKFRVNNGGASDLANAHIGTGVPWTPQQIKTVDWQTTCFHFDAGARTATVLDPFAGALTTAIVAERMTREFIGIELNEDYIKLGIERVDAERKKFEALQRKAEKAGRKAA